MWIDVRSGFGQGLEGDISWRKSVEAGPEERRRG
jgi:hypothetical protein